MYPTKKDIADYLGLDRSTVSKIMNNYDRDKFSPATVARVEQAARELGYAKSQRRQHPRAPLGLRAQVRIELESGSLYGQGEAQVKDISISGALLEDLKLDTMSIPMQPFRVALELNPEGAQQPFATMGRPVRFAMDPLENRMGLALTFPSLSSYERDFLTACVNN